MVNAKQLVLFLNHHLTEDSARLVLTRAGVEFSVGARWVRWGVIAGDASGVETTLDVTDGAAVDVRSADIRGMRLRREVSSEVELMRLLEVYAKQEKISLAQVIDKSIKELEDRISDPD